MGMTEHETRAVVYLTADGFCAAGGVAHGFSTRCGGVSTGIYATLNLGANRGDDRAAVRENYRRFCAAIGADAEKMVFSAQVHGEAIRCVTAADAGKGLDRMTDYDADGLITDVPGLPLVIFSADCIPILLYDPVRRVIAAVHAGWRGTALGIAARAAERMCAQYGSAPADILAAIGPGIGACCFQTHADVPDAMTEALGSAALAYIEVLPTGKFCVDLKGLNALCLQQAGLCAAHIALSQDCTACLPEKYWSHRVTAGQRGSQAAVIQLL